MFTTKTEVTNVESTNESSLDGQSYTFDFTAYDANNDVITGASSTGNIGFVPNAHSGERDKYLCSKHQQGLSDGGHLLLLNDED